MSDTTHTTPAAHGVSTTETAVAVATLAAPVAAGVLGPLLDPQAAFFAGGLTAAWATTTATAYTGALPQQALDALPGGDILKAHSAPMLVSSLASGIALAAGALGGPAATDALMAGLLTPASVPGIVSLGWWAMTGLVGMKLRRILRPPKPGAQSPAAPDAPAAPVPNAICTVWARYISSPDGTHPGQELHLYKSTPEQWSGTIQAPAGKAATVTRETVSSVYRVPLDQVVIEPGESAGEQRIEVHLTALTPLDDATLAGLWAKRIARKGGLLPDTHLEEIQPDPATGGEVAWVVADEDRDSLPAQVDRRDLAGALRTNALLISYEPSRRDPRRAVIRRMDHNPLEKGTPFTGPDMLKPTKGGYFQIGTAVSGRPVRAQLFDPKLGARHLIVTGVTGAGKGGVLQLLALAAHLDGAAILYGDPKGSSNPVIEDMAAHSGLGEEGAMGTLLIAKALLNHRITETARLKQKNFDRTRMPHVVLILDESSSLLGENAKFAPLAVPIMEELTRLGRSMGISVVLADQLLQLARLGSSAVRDNIVGNGGLILLRADSSQRNLIDLPPGLEGCNPADIPATWSADDEHLVYDGTVEIGDPETTFGLGYFATTDAVAAMARALILEDASPYIDPTRVVVPWDWPQWEQRHDIAEQPTATEAAPAPNSNSGTLDGFLAAPQAAPATAEDKILRALEECDPLELPMPVAALMAATGLAESTVQNKAGALVKAGKILRPRKGHYAPLDYTGETAEEE